MAKHNNSGLILIDINLKPISGLDLDLALEQTNPSSTSIILSANNKSEIEQAKEAIKNSAYTFLEKTIQQNKFEMLLKEIKDISTK